jgi:membrane fusion protein, multidrug efflux system
MDDQTLEGQRQMSEVLERPAEPPPPLRKRGRAGRGIGIAVGLLVLVGMLAGGTWYWLSTRNTESTDDAFIDAYVTQVSPRVAGQVTELGFADNDHVTAGQVLVKIDPRDYQARLDQALAQQANADAGLVQARTQVAVQQAAVDQARANIALAESDQTMARQDYDRFKAINPQAVTRQQIDSATAGYHSSQAKLEASHQSERGAEAQLQATQAQVLAAQAALRQADANVETARLQLSYTTILAPVTGTVTHRSVDVGNYVNPGQPLFALVQDDRWVTANFKETQLDRIHRGDAVDIFVDAVPSIQFHGKVDSVQSGTGAVFSSLPAENATGNYVKIVQRVPVKIVFDDARMKDHPLAPGMSVVPTVRLK